MLVLFDHSTPRGSARVLPSHTVITAYAKGWDTLTNGELLKAAEHERVEVLLTADRRIQYQQNLKNRAVAIVVLAGCTRWSQVRLHLGRIAATVDAALPGSYAEITIPFPQTGAPPRR